MTFEFHPDALLEYHEAGRWYEERRHLLGVEFTEAVEAAIAVVLADPLRFQPAAHGIRIYRLRRFPYYIFFRCDIPADHVRIVALCHHKRHPGYWHDRI